MSEYCHLKKDKFVLSKCEAKWKVSSFHQYKDRVYQLDKGGGMDIIRLDKNHGK